MLVNHMNNSAISSATPASAILLTPLPDHCWMLGDHDVRSRELTAFYVHRYNGRREGLTWGRHDFWELTFVFRGTQRMLGDSPCEMPIHTAALIPPYVNHKELSAGVVDTLWVGLRGSMLNHLDQHTILLGNAAELHPMMDQLWRLSQRYVEGSGPEIDGLVRLALGQFLRLAIEPASPGGDVIDDIIGYLHNHCDLPVSFRRVAARFAISERHFYRCFKARTGKNPTKYLNEIRIARAQHMMRQSSLSLKEIAHATGFRSPTYFSRVFHRLKGMPPAAALDEIRGGPMVLSDADSRKAKQIEPKTDRAVRK